jgi:Pyridoxamine 5'-phosphate oxidase
MGALTDKLCDFLDAHTAGVLATASPEGNPRQSLVYFARDGDRLLISTLTDRLKARDVRRTRWASGPQRHFKQVQPTRTALPAQVTEQSSEVIDSAMARLGGDVMRRPVVDLEQEIAAARETQRKAKREARKELHKTASRRARKMPTRRSRS